jgi:iron complex outermembrane receptor protein
VYIAPEQDLSLFALVWTPGQWTPIHDHGSWGVVGVLRGTLHERSYVRVDGKTGDAEIDLQPGGVFLLDPGTITSFVPNPDHIHRTGVPEDAEPVVSLHLYGRNMGQLPHLRPRLALAPPGECRAQRKLARPRSRAASAPGALAQDAQAPDVRTEVVVTATRVPRAGLDVPAAIDVVDSRAIREDKPQVNLSEAINRVPGIVVQNRQNYAQDLQVSSRGFGGRATFGVRGVRLIADGIPATMPDGQGQAATFDLSTAERIEVLRGPFASLYGNASGGVVQVFTADGPPEPTASVSFFGGSYDTWKLAAQAAGYVRPVELHRGPLALRDRRLSRPQRRARDQLNAKLKMAVGEGRLTLVANALDQPETQDPLGLTRAQWEANPEQADASATLFNTRKSISQAQGGAVYDIDAAGWSWSAKGYAGDRQVTQYLGQTGDTPLGSGGVVDLDRQYGGVGLRASSTFGHEHPLTSWRAPISIA